MNGAGLVQMGLGQCLFDDNPANVVADEDDWSSRVVKPVLHEKSKKPITMLDESSVFVIHGESVIVGEEHDAATLFKAAGKDIPGPHLATVGPGVSVHIVIGLNVETMDDDDVDLCPLIRYHKVRISRKHDFEIVLLHVF